MGSVETLCLSIGRQLKWYTTGAEKGKSLLVQFTEALHIPPLTQFTKIRPLVRALST
jgi:hypothetical protein